jgi:hypothetical protein
MSKFEELDKLLTESAEVLVECCSILKEEPVDPNEKNIYRLGKAIYEINEIREQIYRIHPELKPKKWGEPPSEDDYLEMFQEALRQAKEHIQAGCPEKAIETFESYVFIRPGEKYEGMAKSEIEKLRNKYRV